MEKTNLEKYTAIGIDKEKERWILKNLNITKSGKIRKTKWGWTITLPHGTKWLIEFNEKDSFLYFDDEIEGETFTTYPKFMFIYKEKFGLPIKEVVLEDVFEDMLKIHKLLKA